MAPFPLLQRFLHLDDDNNSRWHQNIDRFIPNRSAIDWDHATTILSTTTTNVRKENLWLASNVYQKKLAEAADLPTRILAFRNKPRKRNVVSPPSPPPRPRSKPMRYIPKTCEGTFDLPDLSDDFSLNLLDWGSRNVLSIALDHTIYFWNASDSSGSEFVTVDEEEGPVTSVCWAPDGRHLAVGLTNSHVQLWDTAANKQLRTLKGGHRARVGSLAWNGHILTTGGMDGKIVNNDVRLRSQIINTYTGHRREVCGLKWSLDGKQLASGGKNNVVHIWDMSAVSSNSPTHWLYRFDEHKAAVKALAWCPFQGNLLASGGGGGDCCVKLWNTGMGERVNSVDTGSQVCALLWSKNERELLSSHGLTQNQLTLWKYPSMLKIAELHGHTSRVLHMTQSPDGSTVASAAAAADQTLRFWEVFGTPPAAPLKRNKMPFADFNRIR